jgi:hypothetical protein
MINLGQYLTVENAQEYASLTDKIAFCSDITGLSVSSRRLEEFEDNLELLAIKLGFMNGAKND